MTYTELKNIQYTWKGKVCLFGAGTDRMHMGLQYYQNDRVQYRLLLR